MPSLVIFEDDGFSRLLPLTYWRTCGEVRTGYARLIDYIIEAAADPQPTIACRPELADVTRARLGWPVNKIPADERVLLVNARLLLTERIPDGPVPSVQYARDGRPLIILADRPLAERLSAAVLLDSQATAAALQNVPQHEFVSNARLMDYPWDLVHANPGMLVHCWERAGRPAGLNGRICDGVHILNRAGVHIDFGCTVKPGAVLDAEHGPIYIGPNVTISPNCSIEGPCFIGEGSLVQPGAVVRDAMSIGPRCKVGGELESSIIHGHSNKQHDGFLGHAYVCEWVNLAADTVNSDLKNTYGSVRVPINGRDVDSGQMFVGLMIGDHSKTGIGQMFATGSVVGFGSNVASCQFAPKFVPSFTWLTGSKCGPYDPTRCLDVAKRVMQRRQVVMSPAEAAWFLSLLEYSQAFEAVSAAA